MRQNASFAALEILLREPAGLVCAALVLALVAVTIQIVAVW